MKRSLAILAAMVLALGMVGVGYAAWTSAITIHGTVTTGTLAWVWSGYDGVQMGSGHLDSVAGIPGTNLDISVSNTYPGWKGNVTLYEQNTGTLPLTFDGFRVDVTNDPNGLASHYWLVFYDSPARTHINYAASFSSLNGVTTTYASAIPGWLPAYGLIGIGGTHPSAIGIYLDSSAPQAFQAPFAFTFTHIATVAP